MLYFFSLLLNSCFAYTMTICTWCKVQTYLFAEKRILAMTRLFFFLFLSRALLEMNNPLSPPLTFFISLSTKKPDYDGVFSCFGSYDIYGFYVDDLTRPSSPFLYKWSELFLV
jgi:archaellum biogenesis protein FlaJ (TadC family)